VTSPRRTPGSSPKHLWIPVFTGMTTLPLYLFPFTFFLVSSAMAAPKLAPAHLVGKATEDMAAPYNLQAVVDNHTVSLGWSWDAPDPSPTFLSFGYEIIRDTAVIAIVSQTAFTDFAVPIGSHTYKVRAKGESKDLGKRIAHYSAWSEPTDVTIKQTCAGPPVLELKVEPNKTVYRGIPALRLHFVGDVSVPAGCQLEKINYHIDNGISTPRTGPLDPDAKGHFDEYIDAMGPDEEPINGNATYSINASAKDEAGETISSVFTIDLQQANPFAPHNY
jgi:hypothetical protein